MRTAVIAVLVVGLTTAISRAERPPQKRDEADAVVVGKVKKITTKETEFGGDGTRTDYTAEVEVTKADKGDDVKAGETIKVKWFRVTKTPSKPLAGAYGHAYKIKKDDEAKFWLMGSAKKGFEVIYNSDGVEKVKK
jgi:hypothetical protein